MTEGAGWAPLPRLGPVTVSAVPDELSPEVGGLQNTATNLGAAVLEVNARARVQGLRDALAALLLVAAGALFAAGRIPREPVGAPDPDVGQPADPPR